MKPRHNLNLEQVNRLHSGLHEYVDTDHTCPNCLHTEHQMSTKYGHDVFNCESCGYDYYIVNHKARLL